MWVAIAKRFERRDALSLALTAIASGLAVLAV